ncbi:hypothetical protein CB1_000302025 [Camelus ferus]|nr:hypothetical protein CB1_000302025 [Camelus ferus]
MEIPPAAKLAEAFVFEDGLDVRQGLFPEGDLGDTFLQERSLGQMAVVYKEIPLGEQDETQDDYSGNFSLCSSPVQHPSAPSANRPQDDELFSQTFLQRSDLSLCQIVHSGGESGGLICAKSSRLCVDKSPQAPRATAPTPVVDEQPCSRTDFDLHWTQPTLPGA